MVCLTTEQLIEEKVRDLTKVMASDGTIPKSLWRTAFKKVAAKAREEVIQEVQEQIQIISETTDPKFSQHYLNGAIVTLSRVTRALDSLTPTND